MGFTMTFSEWYIDVELKKEDAGPYTFNDMKAACNAAIDQAQMIAWKHARGIIVASNTCNPCDEVDEEIRQLEAK